MQAPLHTDAREPAALPAVLSEARLRESSRTTRLVMLQDETVRAGVTVMLALLPLPTRARHRVLAFVADQLHEDTAPAPGEDIPHRPLELRR